MAIFISTFFNCDSTVTQTVIIFVFTCRACVPRFPDIAVEVSLLLGRRGHFSDGIHGAHEEHAGPSKTARGGERAPRRGAAHHGRGTSCGVFLVYGERGGRGSSSPCDPKACARRVHFAMRCSDRIPTQEAILAAPMQHSDPTAVWISDAVLVHDSEALEHVQEAIAVASVRPRRLL